MNAEFKEEICFLCKGKCTIVDGFDRGIDCAGCGKYICERRFLESDWLTNGVINEEKIRIINENKSSNELKKYLQKKVKGNENYYITEREVEFFIKDLPWPE